MRSIVEIKGELTRVIDAGLLAGVTNDTEALKAADEQAIRLHAELKDAERDARIQMIGLGTEGAAGWDLASTLLEAGFSRTAHAAVTVPIDAALEFKAGSFSGNIEDAVPDRVVSPPLGIDSRYLFPHLRTESVPLGDTGISSYRQKSRTLANPAAMVKPITSTDTKEETATVSEAVSEPLKMVANVESNTPNVLLDSPAFRSWVNSDLLAAYRLAVDTHVVGEIAAAGIPTGGTGPNFNLFENILYAQETVRAAGYAPTLVVVSPNDALAIQLLTSDDAQFYVFAQSVPTLVISPAVADSEGFVCDAAALGTLYLGGFSFAVFEENAGRSNSSTVRAESPALYLVQRADAAATIAGTS